MSELDRDVYQVYGEWLPMTFMDDRGYAMDLTNAVRVVEFVDNRSPRPARVIDAERGKIAFPDDLEPGDYRLQYEVHWSDDIVQFVPSIPQRVTVKPPDVEVDA